MSMSTIDTQALSEPALAQMLRTWADGVHSAEAAVNLVINANLWLHRPDFRRDCIVAVSDGVAMGGRAPMATINWHAASRYAEQGTASRSQTAMLRLACSVAGVSTGSLRDLTAALDPANTAKLIDAIAHRGGWHVSGNSHTTRGEQPFANLTSAPSQLDERRPGLVNRHRV